jgi:hypothetical protein
VRELTADPVGAWEPSIDLLQWYRFAQVQMLVQQVTQKDGDDQERAPAEPTPVASLVWSPFLAAFGRRESAPFPPAEQLERAPRTGPVLSLLERAADYHLAQPPQYQPAGWENAPFLIGALALVEGLAVAAVPRRGPRARAEANEWKPAAPASTTRTTTW